MALLENWQKIAYNEKTNKQELQRFWQRYFLVEKGVYEKLLVNPDEKVEGTVKELAEKYEDRIPEFMYRLKVKAGLTGYAQVYGKYNTTAYDKLRLDLMYIQNYSLKQDFEIMFRTVQILFMKESTEGVGEGQIAATGEEGRVKNSLASYKEKTG